MAKSDIQKSIEQYQRGVMVGTSRPGRLERLAVERHLADLEAGPKRGLRFDITAAENAIRFCKFIHHAKGEWSGQIFDPAPWEMFILWNLFGWKRDDGTRRFRVAYISMGRKNGKTYLIAVVGHILFIADNEPGAEIYTAATKMDQARLIHSAANSMVKASPELRNLVEIFRDNLSIKETQSKYVPLGGDSGTLDGLNPSGMLIDELHAHKTRGMWDVMDTATGARRQPLLVAITTAGTDRQSICAEQDDYSIHCLEGALRDDSHFAFICRLDKDDDPFDEKNWRKANPNLGVSVKLDDLRRKAAKAKASPASMNAFLRLHLNVWTTAENRWLDAEAWKKCGGAVDIESLAGRSCSGGLDLAKTSDMTALVLAFPDELERMDSDDGAEPEGTYTLLCHFFLPDYDLDRRERESGLPQGCYHQWARKGFLTLTPGATCDYGFVRETILECARRYDLRDVGFDPWNATQMATDLQNDGIEMVEFSQAIHKMNEPCKEFERLVLSGGLRHGDHPILAWHSANVSVRIDANANVAPIKGGRGQSQRNKIDGIVASIMAVARAKAFSQTGRSVYETRGLVTI
jgi:phage terminase large subunit-like protein